MLFAVCAVCVCAVCVCVLCVCVLCVCVLCVCVCCVMCPVCCMLVLVVRGRREDRTHSVLGRGHTLSNESTALGSHTDADIGQIMSKVEFHIYFRKALKKCSSTF